MRALCWLLAGSLAAGAIGTASPASANGYGESLPWQFQTTADMANLAAVLSLIETKKAGGFGPARTTIGGTQNCFVSAAATGNLGTNSESGIEPTSVGPTLTSLGNTSTAQSAQQGL